MLLAAAAALLVVGYLYFWLDDEIRRQVEMRLADHYSNLEVHVGRARFEKEHGIAVFDVTLRDPQSGDATEPILAIDEMYLVGKLRIDELVSGELTIDEIVVRRPELRAIRQADRQWNLRALLPLPDFSDKTPQIKLEDATLTVVDASTGKPAAQTVQGIDILLTPLESRAAEPNVSDRFRVAGRATGLPAREMLVEGEIGVAEGNYDLTVRIGGLEFTSEMLATLPGITLTEQVGADVSGRADITVRLNRPGAGALPTWSSDVEFTRGRVVHPSLPEPLTELNFSATANATRLHLDRLSCRWGPASIVLAGERVGWVGDAPLALAAKIAGLPMNDRLRASLPESFTPFWQRFQPTGIVDAEVRLTFDGQEWRPQISAECRGAALTDAEKFPYRLQQTSGRVEYWPADAEKLDRLRLDLTGFAAGQPVKVAAELSGLAASKPHRVATTNGMAGNRVVSASETSNERKQRATGFVEVSGADIPLHDELFVAIGYRAPKAEQFVRSLRAQGAIDLLFRAEWTDPWQPKAEVTHDIHLKNCEILYDRFPYPLRQVSGLVTQRDGKWTVHDVEGRGWSDATVMICRAETMPEGDGFHTDCSLRATNVALDDNLKLALPPAAQQAWDELRPQGRIDYTVHALFEAGEAKPKIDIVMQSRDRSVSIEPARWPYRLDQVEGVATYNAGRVEIRNLSARHDHAIFSAAAGSWQPTPAGWQAQLTGLNVDRLTPQPDLVAALPSRWQRAIERLQPSGTFGVYNSRVSFAKSHGLATISAAWDINLDFHQAKLGGELPLQSLTGGLHLVGRHDGQSPYTAGELSLDSVVARDLQLTNLRGPLWIDSTHCLLGEPASQKQGKSPRRITADAYGGSISANAELRHQPASAYSLDLRLGGVSVARFANERLGGPRDMSGTASGQLRLSGAGASAQSMRGIGELSVVDANIYELPVLVAMLKVLKVRAPDTTAFNRCDMQFAIEGEQIQFEKLNLLGDAVSLYGKGESDFNRRLDLVFYTLPEPANLPIPLWKAIAGQVSQQALQLKVVGTWDKAEVQPQTLPGFNQVLEQIQNGAATMSPATATRDVALPR